MQLYVALKNGRKNPNSPNIDFEGEGVIFGPLDYSNVQYLGQITLPQGNVLSILSQSIDGQFYYDGVFYAEATYLIIDGQDMVCPSIAAKIRNFDQKLHDIPATTRAKYDKAAQKELNEESLDETTADMHLTAHERISAIYADFGDLIKSLPDNMMDIVMKDSICEIAHNHIQAMVIALDPANEPDPPLLYAAKQVIKNWEGGDLAGAVRNLNEAILLESANCNDDCDNCNTEYCPKPEKPAKPAMLTYQFRSVKNGNRIDNFVGEYREDAESEQAASEAVRKKYKIHSIYNLVCVKSSMVLPLPDKI